MRRPLSWLVRAVRDDSGLTAVEYAVVAGLVIAVGGAVAFWLGQGVNKSSGRVTWANGSSGSQHATHNPAVGPRLVGTRAGSAGQGSGLPLALLSLGVTIAGVGGIFGWHYLRDIVRQGNTRRKVRHTLTGVDGQAALQRLVRKPSREPIVRFKRPDTRLIGRNGPDLHHWVKAHEMSLSGNLAGAHVTARLRPNGPPGAMPAPPPAVPVAG